MIGLITPTGSSQAARLRPRSAPRHDGTTALLWCNNTRHSKKQRAHAVQPAAAATTTVPLTTGTHYHQQQHQQQQQQRPQQRGASVCFARARHHHHKQQQAQQYPAGADYLAATALLEPSSPLLQQRPASSSFHRGFGAAVAAAAALPAVAAARPQPRLRARASVAARFAVAGVPAPLAEGAAEVALPLPTAVESPADDPRLHNPLQRMERLGTGWFGVIAEYEGVVVDSTLEAHKAAWRAVAAELDLPAPLGSTLERIRGLRDDVIIMQLFAWTRNPAAAADIAARKEAAYDDLMGGGNAPAEAPGARAFLNALAGFGVPVALATPLPERRVSAALDRLGLGLASHGGPFAALITAEDNGSPEVEGTYLAAAHALGRPPLRCIVLGASNASVEAAHALGMKAVAVTNGQPAWHFGAADLVVRSPAALTVLGLKSLLAREELVESSTPWDEIRDSAAAAASARGERTHEDDDGRGGFARASSSMDSAATAWAAPAPFDDGDGEGGYDDDEVGGGDAAMGDGGASAADEEGEFEVALPPKGAAFWDLRGP